MFSKWDLERVFSLALYLRYVSMSLQPITQIPFSPYCAYS